jgi:hypothetical protein
MKRTIILLTALLGFGTAAPAQDFDLNIDFYADHYYDYDDDDIYRYGFNINNYAADYSSRFVNGISREFGISRSEIRYYLRRGFSPSDVLFGAELSLQTGRRFDYIMEMYLESPHRNWVNISVFLGVPRGSIRYRYIVDAFRSHYYDWGRYYSYHHPSRPHPPIYHNSWSYFRPNPDPRPHAPGYRPSAPVGRPQARPSAPSSNGGRRPGSTVASPSGGGSHQPAARPSDNGGSRQPATRPSDNGGSRQPATRPSDSGGSRQPATRPSDNGGASSDRRGSSTVQPSESRSSQPVRSSDSSAGSSRRSSSPSSSGSSSSRSSGSGSSSSSNGGGGSRRR